MENMKGKLPMVGAKRGTGLTIWLWLMVIGNVIGVFGNLGAVFAGVYTGFSIGTLIILGLLGIVNLVLISWLFKWQMKGFQGIVITAVIAIIVNLAVGAGVGAVIFGVLGPVILYLFMKPQWKMFK